MRHWFTHNQQIVGNNHQSRCLSYFFLHRFSRVSNPLYVMRPRGNWSDISQVMINCYLSVFILIQWGIPMIVTWKHGILHLKNVEIYAWIITFITQKYQNIIHLSIKICSSLKKYILWNSMFPSRAMISLQEIGGQFPLKEMSAFK